MLVDAHVHFWDPEELEYPWLDSVPSLRCAALPAAYDAAIAAAPIDRVVVVEGNCQPTQARRELELFERLAATDARIGGIVAFVELTVPEARDRAFELLSGCALAKGVRQNIQGHAAGFCLQPSFIEGVCAAARRGFTFDLCLTHDQLPEVIDLVGRCPNTRFVLDHCAKPAIRDGAFDDSLPWASNLARLARFDNVWCKISGLLTEAGPRHPEEDVLVYARYAVDCFGTDRVMYGSDWPVLTLAGDYAGWHRLTRRLTADWPAAEARRFYAENALHVYRL
jgi:L-fuconolactonase